MSSSNARDEELTIVSIMAIDISLAIEISVSNSNFSTVSTTIPIKGKELAPFTQCNATFSEPPPTETAPICYVHLIRPSDVYASVELLIKHPTILHCSGEVIFINQMIYVINPVFNSSFII